MNSTSDSSSNWNTAIWGAGPSTPVSGSGDTYISDGSITSLLRTGNYTNAYFDNTLKLIHGATLINKSIYVHDADFILEDNSTLSAGDNGNTYLNSTSIYVAGGNSGTLRADSAGRNQTFKSIISGSGTLNTTGVDATSINYIDQTANTFSGLWTVSDSTLVSLSNHSLGTGSFYINSGGVLDIRNSDFSDVHTTSDLTIVSGGSFALNSGITSYFSTVNLDGTVLSAGTYTYSDLDAGQQAFFSDSDGTGSFVVIPEPSTLCLFLAGVLAAACLTGRKI
ncbi:hypothetical protein P0Y35_00570 [Kiritimatiellaeota bacterium B1221]|nr:hypothetical protein [Kiritimatiellaeota bacterium B1221]